MDAGEDDGVREEAVRLGHLKPRASEREIYLSATGFRAPSGSVLVTTASKVLAESLAKALAIEEDGVAFFRRASLLAADPRVKSSFYKIAHEKEQHRERLRAAIEEFSFRKLPKVVPPDVYPKDEFKDIECYVCGHQADVDKLPDVCPSCGAARYAFEKEISQETAWSLAATSSKATAKLYRGMASKLRSEARELFLGLAKAEQELAREAQYELSEA